MADLNQEGIFIQVRIKEKTEKGEFNDSLYYSFAEFEALKDEDLVAAKAERVSAWVDFVTVESAKPAYEPTDEEYAAMKAEKQAEIDAIDAKLSE